MAWDHITYVRIIELLYHKMQMPVLERYQLTQIELDVLLFLSNHPELDTAKDIVEIRRLTKSHVSAAVDGLVRRGYLQRIRLPGNRKLIHLVLLPAAEAAVKAGLERQNTFFQVLVQGLSPEERGELDRLLSLLERNAGEAYLRLQREDG